AVGGSNSRAVEWRCRMQGGHGRVVWFPTFDADHHVRRAGTAPAGISVVDERGAVLPATREVLKVCATQRLVVHTGHSSAEQALAIIAAAREEGCDRIVVTHAQFVLGTDLGQTGNPTPADGLQLFVTGLAAEGINREQIQTMGCQIPGALLMG